MKIQKRTNDFSLKSPRKFTEWSLLGPIPQKNTDRDGVLCVRLAKISTPFPWCTVSGLAKWDLQYLSSSPLQPGRHWVADSVSASRESHPSEDLSEPFPGVPLSSWLSSPTWEAVSRSVTGFSLSLSYFKRVTAYLTSGSSSGLMSQCLAIQFSMFNKGFWFYPLPI